MTPEEWIVCFVIGSLTYDILKYLWKCFLLNINKIEGWVQRFKKNRKKTIGFVNEEGEE